MTQETSPSTNKPSPTNLVFPPGSVNGRDQEAAGAKHMSLFSSAARSLPSKIQYGVRSQREAGEKTRERERERRGGI